jgi:hypothetical protein
MRPFTARRGRPSWPRLEIAALALAFVGCLGCVALLAAAQARQSWTRLPTGYVTQACAGVFVTERARLGVWWISPHLARLPPRISRRAACGYVLWMPFLDARGRIVFPP